MTSEHLEPAMQCGSATASEIVITDPRLASFERKRAHEEGLHLPIAQVVSGLYFVFCHPSLGADLPT
jgi:hypothetical protein